MKRRGETPAKSLRKVSPVADRADKSARAVKESEVFRNRIGSKRLADTKGGVAVAPRAASPSAAVSAPPGAARTAASPVVSGAAGAAIAAGLADRPTAKQRAAVQREIGRLLDQLAPERPPARGDAPAGAVLRHRSPGRCVLQGAEHAVSVSWFPASTADDALGEVQVIEWRGVVNLPGSTRRADGGGAVPVRRALLHPVEGSADVGWTWRPQSGGRPIGTAHLAEYCQRLLERRRERA
jgi:hypothetical protein